MCTVIIEVPSDPAGSTLLLAVRDEDPARDWDGPGAWWPAEPETIGVRDRLAGGAWLAYRADSGRLAVILNRAEPVTSAPGLPLLSRGGIVLDAVAERELPERPRTQSFNLVSVAGSRTGVQTWDGTAVRIQQLEPGLHMIAHHEVDDPRTARIARWRPEFERVARTTAHNRDFERWSRAWLALLAETARLSPGDDEAIIRDNNAHGFPTQSLLVCVAEVGDDRVELASMRLDEPAHLGSGGFRGLDD